MPLPLITVDDILSIVWVDANDILLLLQKDQPELFNVVLELGASGAEQSLGMARLYYMLSHAAGRMEVKTEEEGDKVWLKKMGIE